MVRKLKQPFARHRAEQLRARLRAGSCTVAQLCDALHVTEGTVRRYLQRLRGEIHIECWVRTHAWVALYALGDKPDALRPSPHEDAARYAQRMQQATVPPPAAAQDPLVAALFGRPQ